MKEVRYEEMIRLSMRAGLTPDEEAQLDAFLAAHPEARAESLCAGRAWVSDVSRACRGT